MSLPTRTSTCQRPGVFQAVTQTTHKKLQGFAHFCSAICLQVTSPRGGSSGALSTGVGLEGLVTTQGIGPQKRKPVSPALQSPSGASLTAAVLSFHMSVDDRMALTAALDRVTQMLANRADFRGLLCFGDEGVGHEIMLITLWESQSGVDAHDGPELARQQISAITDLGVRSKAYDVLRFVRGVITP